MSIHVKQLNSNEICEVSRLLCSTAERATANKGRHGNKNKLYLVWLFTCSGQQCMNDSTAYLDEATVLTIYWRQQGTLYDAHEQLLFLSFSSSVPQWQQQWPCQHVIPWILSQFPPE